MRKTLLGLSLLIGGSLAARAQTDVVADKAKLDALYDGAGAHAAAPQAAFGQLRGIGGGLSAEYRGYDHWDHGHRDYDHHRGYDHDRRHPPVTREPSRPDHERDTGVLSGRGFAILGAVLLGVILLALLL